MSIIGVQDNLREVKSVLDENGITYETLPHDRIDKIQLDNCDIVIVSEQSNVSKNAKDVTVIETTGISPDEVYEKVKYLQ